MKILYLHQYFVTPSMSGGTRSFEMARRWVGAGHEVHVVTSLQRPVGRATRWVTSHESGIHVHWHPVPYSNTMSFQRRMLSFAHFAAIAGPRAIEIGGDVVFATSTPLTIAVPALRTRRALRVPMVFEVRDLWPELPIAIGAIRSPLSKAAARWLERRAYHGSAAVIALSPGMSDGVAATGYPRERIFVVPNSSDVEFFQRGGAALPWEREVLDWIEAGSVVLYAGTLGRINRVEYLVDVAQATLRRGGRARFLVVGSGAEEENVRKRAEAAGVLGRNFRMLSPVPKVCMPTLFARAAVVTSLFVDLPAMRHNSANKFFDGLAAGKPVAINYLGWHRELIERHGVGLALEPGNADAAAAALEEFLGAPTVLESAGRAALQLATKQFARDLLADRALRVLQSSVDGTLPAARAAWPRVDA